MKYLFLNSAGVWGGNEKWAHMAATSLAKENPVFIAYKNAVVGDRYSIEKIKLPFRFSYDPATIVPLINFVNKNGIDVIIPTKKRDYVIAGIVARKCRKKNVLRLGIVRKLGQNPYKNFVYNTLSHGIIVNAQRIKDVLLDSPFISEEKIRVIYNGLDTGSLDEQADGASQLNKPFQFTVCTAGRISKRKGLDVILQIFAEFSKRIQSGEGGMVIIGSGRRIKEYQSLASQLGISKQVWFAGYLENPYPYLKLSDVYLTVSRNEGISNALLEAMYLENAVITSRAGGAGEIIVDRQNGLLLEKDNIIRNGSDRLYELYTDTSFRESLGKAAKETVTAKCSVSRMTSEIKQFCTDIVSGSK